MITLIQAHPLSEASRAADAAYAGYFMAVREGVWLWRTGAAQEAKDACRAEKEAAYSKWRQLISEIGSGA
ncbi:hypothetical protein GCM10022631_12090 [Deinococcus rubellus]|uniref:Uncharacterized protein n=1 Tax=Deinococcus rubellus TaxID=1889240 RepID=A0ABY5YCG5_9DEIO|nr:hypothetical protein [Deinococcus rubellus]UWX62745.1 hypothetical protein N0D28_08160 [Deinococcus rubellus]